MRRLERNRGTSWSVLNGAEIEPKEFTRANLAFVVRAVHEVELKRIRHDGLNLVAPNCGALRFGPNLTTRSEI